MSDVGVAGFPVFKNIHVDIKGEKYVEDFLTSETLLRYESVRTSYKLPTQITGQVADVGYDSITDRYLLEEGLEGQAAAKRTEFDTMEELLAACRPICRVPAEVEHEIRVARSFYGTLPGSRAKLGKKFVHRQDLNQNVARAVHMIESVPATVFLDNLKGHFLTCIKAFDAALCAMYTMTDQDIIEELSRLKWVSVILDKEQTESNRCQRLRNGWKAITFEALEEHDGINSPPGSSILMNYGSAGVRPTRYPSLPALRLASLKNAESGKNFASFHTKFCVFGDVKTYEKEDYEPEPAIDITPRAVWIGSYNPTATGDLSIQSAVLLRDPLIVSTLAGEFLSLNEAVSSNIGFRNKF